MKLVNKVGQRDEALFFAVKNSVEDFAGFEEVFDVGEVGPDRE